jgi:hypothetical protein
MTTESLFHCVRETEVEAMHDGRLAPVDQTRIERHITRCASCRAHRSALLTLRTEATHASQIDVAPLALRRARAALLREASLQREASGPGARPRFRVAGIFALAAALVATLAVVRMRDHAPRHNVSTNHPVATVDVVGETEWSRVAMAHIETVRLARGIIRVSVPHQHAAHRFVIALPDGEIEVRGTQFLVEVRDQHTQRLDVFEGLVALRLVNDRERLVAAHEAWVRSPDVPEAPVRPTFATPHDVAPSVVSRRHALRTHSVVATPRVVAEDPMAIFSAGLRALERGDLGVAATSFGEFERLNPNDDRAEDAGFLRVMALRRSGQNGSVQTAAHEYLARYSHGTRRWEVARMAARIAAEHGDCATVQGTLAEFAQVASKREEIAQLLRMCEH